MVNSCSAINCSVRDSAATKALGITFHRFPKDPMKRKAWALATRREGVKSGTAWVPTKCAMLCSKHFLEKDYEVTQATRRLRENVIPSVFEFQRHASKSKDPIIIHTRSCENADEPPTTNLPDPITQNNENTTKSTKPLTSNPPNAIIILTENSENTTNRSTTNFSDTIIPTRNDENTAEPPTSNLSEPSYAVQEDEVQFLENKLKTTKVKYEEGYKKLCVARNEISEQNGMIFELLNDLASLKKHDEVNFLKRNLEKTEAKYEEVRKNLRVAQKEISEQNLIIRVLLNELASSKMEDE